MDIQEQVKKHLRLLKHHIGLGGNAHLPVNNYVAGFMTPNQKKDLEMAKGEARIMPVGTDILTLPPGIYNISGGLNNPIGPGDLSWIYYEVIGEGVRRKIEATVSGSGAKFFRTIHFDGTPESGTGKWVNDRKQQLLWKGYESSGTITLSESISKFDVLEIGYHNGQGYSVIHYAGSNKLIDYPLTGCGFNDTVSTKQAYIYEALLKTTETTLTFSRNVGIVIGPSGVTDTTLTNPINLIHVIGIKY